MSNIKEIKKLKVLIADDIADSRNMLEDWLKLFEKDLNAQFEVIQAQNGKEAVEAYDKYLKTDKPIQIAIIDYIMPELDGREVINHIGKKHAIPVIAFSGDIRSENLDFIKEGAIMFLPKPFEVENFKTAVNNAIELSSTDSEIIFAEDALKILDNSLKK